MKVAVAGKAASVAVWDNVGVGDGVLVRVGVWEARGVNGAEVAITTVGLGEAVSVGIITWVGGGVVSPSKKACTQFQPPRKKNAAISRAAINPQKVAGFMGF